MPPSLCCAQASLYCAQVFIATLEPIHGRLAKQPGGEFCAYWQKLFLSRPDLSRQDISRATDPGSRTHPASVRWQANRAGADASFSQHPLFWRYVPYQRALLSVRSRVKCPLPDIALACPTKRAQRTDGFPGIALDGFVTRENTKRYRRFAGE